MHGVRAAGATANMLRAAAAATQRPEGSAKEEAAETRAEKAREQVKAAAAKAPTVAPSRNKSGRAINLVA